MRVLFAGTPGIAVPSLQATARAHVVCAVLTGRDQPVGRGRSTRPSEVKEAARALGLRVLEADGLDVGIQDAIRDLAPELLVVVAFGRIFRQSFLDLFPRGGVNVHPSLLPRHRGLHTHRRALEAGDAVHGASVHFVTPELDGGPVVIQARVPVRAGDDEASLASRVLAWEHRIYPECIGWFAAGRLACRDGRVLLDGRELEAPLVRDGHDELAA